jgi:homoserine dehydrogenase
VVDSFDELERLAALHADDGVVPRVLVRVTPGVEAHTHEFVRTGQIDSKFGFGLASGDAARAVARAQDSPAVELVGVHMHIGSQVFVADFFHQAVEVVAPWVRELDLPELSIGGGLGVAYVEGEEAPTITEWGTAVVEGCRAAGITARVSAEPGRAIVAQAALTLYTVGTMKEIPGVRTYLSVDGGMSDNPRPVLYGSGYEAFLPRATDAPRPRAVTVVGKHCESGDVLVRDARVPTTSPSATCWPRRSPAPTATPWAPTTTRSPDPRWSSWPTAGPARWSGGSPSTTCSSPTSADQPPPPNWRLFLTLGDQKSTASSGTGVAGRVRGRAWGLYDAGVTSEPVRIGLLGCGNVGAALVEVVQDQADVIEARTGLALEIARVAVRSASRDRPVELADGVLTTDAASVVADPSIDVVVEVIGGIEPARELILAALEAKKPVVTANKELVANHGAELFAAADAAGVDLLFEAAVAGGIPVIRPLRESLVGEHITRVMGIVNGTTNYILTRMTEEGTSYADALAEAQSLGYAERDPTADVEGFDAGAKAAIIASIAFGARVVAGDVYHEGISGITQTDIGFARRLGYVIKLLAITEVVTSRSPSGSTRRWCRSTIRWPRSARASTPCSSRATPSVTSCSTAAEPAAGPPPRPCSATSSTPPPTGARARTPASARWPRSGSGPSTS